MKRFLKTSALAAALAVVSYFPASAAEDAPLTVPPTEPLTVVELFTSQGCSSCPPADKFLGELSQRPDLLALSVHVDYWDYIGWKDVFADPKNTKRQRRYAQKLGLRYVYTPQMVIQGAFDSTGSDRAKVLRKIKEAGKLERLAVTISRAGDGVRITVPGSGTAYKGEPAAVWLVAFDRRHDTEIKRGENSGNTLSYFNVVRGMTRIGAWSGRPLDIVAKAADMPAPGRDSFAVIVQSLKTGRILGAARLDLKSNS